MKGLVTQSPSALLPSGADDWATQGRRTTLPSARRVTKAVASWLFHCGRRSLLVLRDRIS